MREKIIEIVGRMPGPTDIILGGIHGNETCGVKAIDNVLPKIKIDNGRVLFGYGNPRAIAANKRYTEANLNRLFQPADRLTDSERRSYEFERAQELIPYLDRSEALLDIHASYTPKSRPFVICEPNACDVVEYLPADLVVTNVDDTIPGGTDYFMNKKGKVGICLECGYLGDQASDDRAEEGISAFLKARGRISGRIEKRDQTYLRVVESYRTRTGPFRLRKPYKDFEPVQTDEIIGSDGNEEVRSSGNRSIVFARNRDEAGEEAFILCEKTDLSGGAATRTRS